jgi:hypothetical protein
MRFRTLPASVHTIVEELVNHRLEAARLELGDDAAAAIFKVNAFG